MADTTVRARLPDSFRGLHIESAIARTHKAKWGSLPSDVAKELGRKRFLSDREAAALIARVMPPRGLDPDVLVWLSVGSSPLKRLLADISVGRLAFPIKPRELFDWADGLGIALHEAFIHAVRSQQGLTKKGIDEKIQTWADHMKWVLHAEGQKTVRKTDIADALKKRCPNLDLPNKDTLLRRFTLKTPQKQ